MQVAAMRAKKNKILEEQRKVLEDAVATMVRGSGLARSTVRA